MSYCTWHNYGYGICTDDIEEHNIARLQALLARAPKFSAAVHAWLAEEDIESPTWDDYMAFDDAYDLGLATILKEVIQENEGLELTACDEENGTAYLLYQPRYPWEMTEQDKAVTKEYLQGIFRQYVMILTDTPVETCFQAVENGG